MAVVVDVLQIDLIALLVAVEVPGLRVLVQVGHIAGAEAGLSGVEAHEGAGGVVAAEGLAHIGAHGGGGIAREGLDRAAQVAGRGHTQPASAGREHHTADVLAGQRTGRAEAVVVAVLLVAQRHVIHGVAELLGGEAVHEQGFVLLVVAPGIGGFEQDARQGLNRLQRVDTRHQLLDFRPADRHRRTRCLGRSDHHFGHRGRRIDRRLLSLSCAGHRQHAGRGSGHQRETWFYTCGFLHDCPLVCIGRHGVATPQVVGDNCARR